MMQKNQQCKLLCSVSHLAMDQSCLVFKCDTETADGDETDGWTERRWQASHIRPLRWTSSNTHHL